MANIANNLTYRQLITQIVEFNKKYPQLDILNQPVTFSSPEASGEYYNVTNLCKEQDGHLTMEQNS